MSFPFLAVFFVCFLDGFVDKHAAVPNFTLVNQSSLDKILKAEVFVHSDGQLRATHLILGYNPLSSSFQVQKCVIKTKDLRLHLINVAVPGFLNPSSGPQGVLKVEPLLQYKPEDKPTPLQLVTKEEEEDQEEEEKEEEIVDVSDSEDDYKVFN